MRTLFLYCSPGVCIGRSRRRIFWRFHDVTYASETSWSCKTHALLHGFLRVRIIHHHVARLSSIRNGWQHRSSPSDVRLNRIKHVVAVHLIIVAVRR